MLLALIVINGSWFYRDGLVLDNSLLSTSIVLGTEQEVVFVIYHIWQIFLIVRNVVLWLIPH